MTTEDKTKSLKGKVLQPFGFGQRKNKRMTKVGEIVEFGDDTTLYEVLLKERKIQKA